MVLIALLLHPLIHYLADFEAQTDKMALNKSKSFKWLTIHVGVYSLLFTLIFGLKFGAVIFALHWITDFLTSRWTSKLWAEQKRHRFFCVIGLDQMLHQYQLLIVTLWLQPIAFWWLF